MDPARFYGIRVPPVDDSEDSCLSDSDSEYSPHQEHAAPADQSGQYGSDTGAQLLLFRLAYSHAPVQRAPRAALFGFYLEVGGGGACGRMGNKRRQRSFVSYCRGTPSFAFFLFLWADVMGSTAK